MTVFKQCALSAVVILAGLSHAVGEDGNGNPGTVNYFTPAQKAQAFRAAAAAGFTPTVVGAFQDGNFFLTAQKEGELYQLTVVPSGHVYASTSGKGSP